MVDTIDMIDNKTRPVILDTSAILSGKYDLTSPGIFVPPSVIEEIKKGKIGRLVSLSMDTIKVIEPDNKYLEKVRNAAVSTGDIDRMSNTDIDAVALALQLSGILVTDDYSMQNTSFVLGIEVSSANMKKIGKIIKWTYKCTGCGHLYAKKTSSCPICGHELKNYPAGIRKRT